MKIESYMAAPGILFNRSVQQKLAQNPKDIIAVISKFYNTSAGIITGMVVRRGLNAEARMMGYFFIKKYTDLTLNSIAHLFKTDSSTVRSGALHIKNSAWLDEKRREIELKLFDL